MYTQKQTCPETSWQQAWCSSSATKPYGKTRLVLIAQATLQHAQGETASLTVRAGTQPAPWPAVAVWTPFSTSLDQTRIEKLTEKMKQLVWPFKSLLLSCDDLTAVAWVKYTTARKNHPWHTCPAIHYPPHTAWHHLHHPVLNVNCLKTEVDCPFLLLSMKKCFPRMLCWMGLKAR